MSQRANKLKNDIPLFGYGAIVNRLSQYDSTGLSIERVQELAKLQLEGRLFESKFPIDTKVWVVDGDSIQCGFVQGVTYISEPMTMVFTCENESTNWRWHYNRNIFGNEEEARSNLQ